APKSLSVDVGNPVVAGQTLVDERVVRLEKGEDAPILADDAVDEEFRFPPKGRSQVVVEIGEQTKVRRDGIQVARMQPLNGEVGRQIARPVVREQTSHLLFVNVGLSQLLSLSQVQQLVVGNAAPQKERQTRREVEVADRVGGFRGKILRIVLHAEQE